ncbi:translation initiation factor IF-2 [Homalodisca vitripennis]|uniref:translation initiation factor IF-2 n=1 Tax=Homalodisca vitripennis TaxID=197043 RepID=UPI001EEB7BDB|nr:translation initiation factor IF-2 [Homalodisca vitripennis]
MTTKSNQRAALLQQLCRICGRVNKNCVPVFGESGKKQNIHKKMHSCLPVIVEETDTLPKQICLTCLPKLDATWELHQLCKEGQLRIERKLHAVSNHYEEEENSSYKMNLIEEKVRSLSENRPIIFGESAIISLAPPSPPPPPKEAPVVASPSPDTMMVLPEQVMIVEQPPVPYQPVPVKDTVYPEGLIQVNPPRRVAPKRRMPAPKILPPPSSTNTRGTLPLPSPRRQALREGDSANVPQPKKSLQMCNYCNKSFPDDIIDHHVNLHLRQSFFTCIDCNKNFRSEEAMSRHRCGAIQEPINLDPD